ncbi:hypothetical protein [Brevibacterium litoralis]
MLENLRYRIQLLQDLRFRAAKSQIFQQLISLTFGFPAHNWLDVNDP